MAGGVAVIQVGATETELKERKNRMEDALAATRAAVEEVLWLGEEAFVESLAALEKLTAEEADELTGIKIIKKALEEPLRQLFVMPVWKVRWL